MDLMVKLMQGKDFTLDEAKALVAECEVPE